MKNIVLVALMLLCMSLPTNARVETTSDSLSVLLWLEFKVNNRSDDIDENDEEFQTFSLEKDDVVIGKLYTDGNLELTFEYNATVAVSIKINDAEVSNTEFIPIESDRTLTFDLDDFGKGMYEVNVTMSDGCVQTAAFEY